jgi:hypothetical protein
VVQDEVYTPQHIFQYIQLPITRISFAFPPSHKPSTLPLSQQLSVPRPQSFALVRPLHRIFCLSRACLVYYAHRRQGVCVLLGAEQMCLGKGRSRRDSWVCGLRRCMCAGRRCGLGCAGYTFLGVLLVWVSFVWWYSFVVAEGVGRAL